MEKHILKIKRSEKNLHRSQAFVQTANKDIGEKIFSHQYSEEMLMKESERSRKWVKRLPEIIKTLNSSVIRLIGKEPMKAYKEKIVDEKIKTYFRPVGFEEKRIDTSDISVRYLLEKGEEEGGNFRRATDPIWSNKIYSLEKTQISKDQPVLYFLENGPKRGFVREEIQIVPFDTELPPEFVLK